MRAGVSVRLTRTVTATQIAIGGPVVEKMAILAKPSEMAPRMTVAAEASSAGPTRVAAVETASREDAPSRRSSRKRLSRNTQ
jgi:hypothetical protein